jgi:hypothetical protein
MSVGYLMIILSKGCRTCKELPVQLFTPFRNTHSGKAAALLTQEGQVSTLREASWEAMNKFRILVQACSI